MKNQTDKLEKIARVLLQKLSERAAALEISEKNEFLGRLKYSILRKKDDYLKQISNFSFSDVKQFLEFGRENIVALGNASSLPTNAFML